VAQPNPQTIAYPAPGARPHRKGLDALAPHVIVLFGATGDLAKRKLLPGLAYLQQSAFAPDVRIIGTAMEDLTDDDFRAIAKESIHNFGTHRLADDQCSRFCENLSYVPQGAGPDPRPPSAPTPGGCTTCRCRPRRRTR
jgi:glucose-6-phosphate 1-dehydrogenase